LNTLLFLLDAVHLEKYLLRHAAIEEPIASRRVPVRDATFNPSETSKEKVLLVFSQINTWIAY
jgi:hypothetical protein